MELLIDIGGWFGAILLLVGYVLVSTRRVGGSSVRYQGLNVAGSILVGANAFFYNALPSFSINVVWIGIGVTTLAHRRRAKDQVD